MAINSGKVIAGGLLAGLVFSEAMITKGSAFALISVLVGSVAGAWAYKE